MKRFPVVLAIALGLATQGVSASAMTLEEALVTAYGNNPTLKSQQASLRASDELVSQAISNWRPTVSVSASAGVERDTLNSRSGTQRDQYRSPKSVSATLSQNLYRGGRTIAQTNQAEAQVLGERADLTVQEQNILLDAATAYLNVLRDQAVLELNISNEKVLQRQLEATQDRFRVGEITRTDVSQAEARLSGSTADRIQAEGDLEVSRANFANVIGQMPDGLDNPPVISGLPESRDSAIDMALKANPSVLSVIYDEVAAGHNIDLIKGELLPTVTFSSTASRSLDSSSETSANSNVDAVVSLSVPLYQSGSVYSRLRAARQEASQQRMNLEQARRDAIESAAQAWEELTSGRARIKSIEAQINAAEVALDGVQREATVGSRTVLDVLDAEQELLDAKVSLVRAQRNEMVAVFNLKAAVGQMTVAGLGLPVTSYDPKSHYEEVRDKWFGGTSTGDGEGAGTVTGE
ncbi:TolC family outer membrane protein [Magnetospira sp. QH-2]|uniref:TolC family outer membrane protein n=1 Tax=Magnetospira sp. (strain QH-2) TaxID=1288970 RepID=UPI0003E81146|nr:TolC family outer membrane protein [Magnetospira sp. QH-2]CCQ73437.1 Putative outer membrane protein tolC precursor [Magnetospira sp. QH-2]